MPNYNFNIMILMLKTDCIYYVDWFSPITLANFKFKIVSKVITDRLTTIMPNIISKHKKCFVHGKYICVSLAYEAFNLLHKKYFGGNSTLKMDIFNPVTLLTGGFFCSF